MPVAAVNLDGSPYVGSGSQIVTRGTTNGEITPILLPL
jgi:hypothetical protein